MNRNLKPVNRQQMKLKQQHSSTNISTLQKRSIGTVIQRKKLGQKLSKQQGKQKHKQIVKQAHKHLNIDEISEQISCSDDDYTESDSDYLTKEEKLQALKDFGFDGIFNINDDFFDAAKAIKEDDEHEERPLDLGAELGLGEQQKDNSYNDVDRNQFNSTNQQNAMYQTEKFTTENKQVTNKNQKQKQNKIDYNINSGTQDIISQTIKADINLLNEGNTIEIAKQLSSKIIDNTTIKILSLSIQELILNDDIHGCYMQATSAVFLRALRLYISPALLHILYNDIIDNKNIQILNFIAFGVHFNVFHERVLEASLYQIQNINITQILTILRSVILDLSYNMRQQLLQWYNTSLKVDAEINQVLKLRENLFTELLKQPQKPTLYESAYFKLLEQQMKSIDQEANVLGLRQQVDVLWAGNVDSQQQLLGVNGFSDNIQENKQFMNIQLLSSTKIKAPGEGLQNALNQMLEMPGNQALMELQIALDHTKDQQEVARRLGRFTEQFLERTEINLGSLRTYETIMQRNLAIVRNILIAVMSRIDTLGSKGAQNLARVIAVVEDNVVYRNSRQTGPKMLLVHDLAVIWAIEGKRQLDGADISGTLRRLDDDRWGSKLVAATGMQLSKIITALRAVTGQ